MIVPKKKKALLRSSTLPGHERGRLVFLLRKGAITAVRSAALVLTSESVKIIVDKKQADVALSWEAV